MLVPGFSSSDCNITESAHSNPPLYAKQLDRLSETRTHKLITFLRSSTGVTTRNLSPSEDKTIGRKNTTASMAFSKYSMSNKLMSVKPTPVYCAPHSRGDNGLSSLQISGVEIVAEHISQKGSIKQVSNWEATNPAMDESDRDSTPEKRRTDNFKKKSNGHLLRNATLGAPVKNKSSELAEDSIGIGLHTATNPMNSGKTIPMAAPKPPLAGGAKTESVSKNFIKEALNFSLPGKELVIRHQDFILCQKLSASGNIKSILVKRNKSMHGSRWNRSSTSGSKKVRFSKNKIQIEYELEEDSSVNNSRKSQRPPRNRSHD